MVTTGCETAGAIEDDVADSAESLGNMHNSEMGPRSYNSLHTDSDTLLVDPIARARRGTAVQV